MDIQKGDKLTVFYAIARKRLFESLSIEQQIDLITSATDCYARSSNHGSIEQALNEMIDLLLKLKE